MSNKPLKNSKGVNKPFRSPFSTTPRNNTTKINVNTPKSNVHEVPLRISVSKKLFLETPPSKKFRLNEENHENETNVEHSKLFLSDLESLKRRIEEKQRCVSNLKTTLLYKKKNKAENLEAAIKKWTDSCQIALRDYQNDLQDRNGQPTSMTEILFSFGIDSKVVHFSTDNDTFY